MVPYTWFGVRVPRNEKDARELDKICVEKFGEAKWDIAEKTEVGKLNEYESFKDIGKKPPPHGYRYIKVFFVYAVKHDL